MRRPRLHIVFVPGLADKLNYTIGQRTALLLWRGRRVRAHYFVVNWANKRETYEQKLQRLLQLIDHLNTGGNHVAIIGASAGSSLALTAFTKRKDSLVAAVSVCGKLFNPQTVPDTFFKLNPAFKASMAEFAHIEPTLTRRDRVRIATTRCWHDAYVPPKDGTLAYTHSVFIPSAGHVFTIFMAITIFRHRLIRFIKRAEKLQAKHVQK